MRTSDRREQRASARGEPVTCERSLHATPLEQRGAAWLRREEVDKRRVFHTQVTTSAQPRGLDRRVLRKGREEALFEAREEALRVVDAAPEVHAPPRAFGATNGATKRALPKTCGQSFEGVAGQLRSRALEDL